MKEYYIIRSLSGKYWNNINGFSFLANATIFETMYELMDCLKDATEIETCEIIKIYKNDI